MKRNNVAKRFGIGALCLATAITAISGVKLMHNEVAVAEGLTSIAPLSLVTASESATVTYEDGVRISADTEYSGEINYTFTDNAKFVVNFPNESDGTWWTGHFVYRISDAMDDSNYFDIVYDYQTRWTNSAGVLVGYVDVSVQYNGEYRSASASGSTWYNASKLNNTITKGFCGDNNTMTLEWNKDVLQVGVARHTDLTWPRTIAAFDGTEEFVSGTSWGLPKMKFDNGYKVSFFSKLSSGQTTDKGTDIKFTMIRHTTTQATQTYNLDANTVANTETVTIAERGESYQNVLVGNVLTIPTATYGENETAIEKVEIIEPDGKITSVTAGEGYTVGQKGLHTVKYTTTAGSVAAFSFKAKEMIKTTDFVHTAAAVSQDENGLLIASNEPYKATFKGVFRGDTTLNFRFPETYTDWWGGDFKVRLTDATDDTNYFEVHYQAKTDGSGYHHTQGYVEYNGQIRSSRYYSATEQYYNAYQHWGNAVVSPSFLNTEGKDNNTITRQGVLSFVWDGDVLSVMTNNPLNDSTRTIAAFDGTETFIAKDTPSWGLPKLNFANGYTISVSSSFDRTQTSASTDNSILVTDKATDVLFTSIQNGTTVYDLKTSTIEKDTKQVAFEDTFEILTAKDTAGKVFLGWKNVETGELYPAYSAVRKQEGVTYEAVMLGFNSLSGATVRVDTSENGKSGIRFQTLFNTAEYETVKDYIQSFGTLIAYTDTLTTAGREFTITNYEGVSTFAKVQNTKGTYSYKDTNGEACTAYSMALVDIKNYEKAYSARGYIVVEYMDGTTQTIYTDYNAENNSRSIQQVAQRFKELAMEAYEEMTPEQKAIIDNYAGNE